jgi:hypothetical protein
MEEVTELVPDTKQHLESRRPTRCSNYRK